MQESAPASEITYFALHHPSSMSVDTTLIDVLFIT